MNTHITLHRTSTNKFIYYLGATLTLLISVFGISLFFYSSSFLSTLLAQSLHLHVAPSFIGGEIAQDFFDDAGDDSGSDILVYPSNTAFKEGSLDLVRYTVHKPVFDAKWQAHPEYWQIDLEYKSGPASVRTIMIYIDADGDRSGSTKTLYDCSMNNGIPGAENCMFDSAHPWDYAIQICDDEGKVYAAQKDKSTTGTPAVQFICNTELSFAKNDKEVNIRIPLENKQLQKIYTAKTTYHYVLTGGFSKWDRGTFLPLEKRRTLSRGSTKQADQYNPLIPLIYDVLDDSSDKRFSQTAQLSSWSKDDFTRATLHPVTVSMNEQPQTGNTDDFIAEVKKQYTASQSSHDAPDAPQSSSSGNGSPFQRALTAFNNGDSAAAEQLLKEVIETEPENAEALAYYGSCIAMRGGNSSVIEAVKLVNDSFVYLDKAAALAQGTPQELTVLMNRASVCAAVPDAVFGKAAAGAEDFLKCASLYKTRVSQETDTNDAEHSYTQDEKLFLAYLYVSAYDCYKTAGKETEALLAVKEAERIWKQNK